MPSEKAKESARSYVPTGIARCGLVSEVDGTTCLLYRGHVDAHQFNEEKLRKDREVFIPVEKSEPEQTPVVSSAITKAADPHAPRDRKSPQSALQHRFDLIDAPALFEMTGVLYIGAKKYGDDSWRRISVEDHLNHLIAHAYAYLSGDRSDDHLSNVMCRSMFAKGKDMRPDFLGKWGPLDEA